MATPIILRLSILALALIFALMLGSIPGKAEEDQVPTETGKPEEYQVPSETGEEEEGQVATEKGKAEEDLVPTETGKEEEEGAHVPKEEGTAGATSYDPAHVVAKALLCFNDKYIYSSCEESYRLTESGNLDVPLEKAEAYCSGPCLTETHLVLNCIEKILYNFEFYNKATVHDVRDTIHAGCGYGPERGHFNVEEHIEAERSHAQKVANQVLFGLGLMVIGHGVLL